MAKKPREQWHNFDYSQEKRLGQISGKISLTSSTLQKLITQATDRVKRDTGLRFKLSMIAKPLDEDILLRSRNPYVFPNKSAHTSVYNSDYNRLEVYLPASQLYETEYIKDTEVAISFNKETLEAILPLLLSHKDVGITIVVSGDGAFEMIDKKKSELFASFQIFSREDIFEITGSCDEEMTAIDMAVGKNDIGKVVKG